MALICTGLGTGPIVQREIGYFHENAVLFCGKSMKLCLNIVYYGINHFRYRDIAEKILFPVKIQDGRHAHLKIKIKPKYEIKSVFLQF